MGVGVFLFGCLVLPLASADDFFWTNTSPDDFTNANNWVTNGLSVTVSPGGSDNADFTNNATYTVNWTVGVTNANAFINPLGGMITQAMGASTWLVTNSYIVGQTGGKTGSIAHTSGILVVTNSAGTASLIIGQAGRGVYHLTGGTLVVNHLFATNVTASDFNFSYGTLTVNGDSMVSNAATSFLMGNTAGTTSTGNFNGGIFQIRNAFTKIGAVAGSTAIVNVIGSTTVFSNGDLFIGDTAKGARLTSTNGARVMDRIGSIGNSSGSDNNSVLISDNGTVWTNSSNLILGNFGSGNSFFISNGAAVFSTGFAMGSNGTSSNNTMVIYGNSAVYTFTTVAELGFSGSNNLAWVTGTNALWKNAALLDIGRNGSFNRLVVSNSGVVISGNGTSGGSIGVTASAISNSAVVTDAGSFWTNNGSLTLGSGAGSTLLITNGGSVIVTKAVQVDNGSKNNSISIYTGSKFYSGGNSSVGVNNTNNFILVSGSGAVWTNGGTLTVGFLANALSNRLTISGSGVVANFAGTIGSSSGANSNWVVVTDSGSVWSNVGGLFVGKSGAGNFMIISNGASVVSTTGFISSASSGSNNYAVVTGNGSIWQNLTSLNVGSNSLSSGASAWLTVLNGGTVEADTLQSGFNSSGFITNQSGIFQFISANPTVTTNTPNSIVLTNGVISYRNVTGADIFNSQISNIVIQGANTFRLNASTNASVASYMFGTNNGNLYQHLSLIHGSTRWQSTAFTMGPGGIFFISNTTATVSGLFTNNGTVNVFGSRVTYEGPVVVSGAYLSDPSTNIFSTNVIITSSGYIQAAAGDVYQFERDFSNQSTQSNLFNMSSAIAVFTNSAGEHVFDMTGSSALDRGTNGIFSINDVTNNFAIGTLIVAGVGDTLRVTGAVNNSLYVSALDLGGLANTNHLVTDVNVYYDGNLAANSYLNKASYDLPGAGMLIPYGVPEPAILLWITAGLIGAIKSRRGSIIMMR